MPVLLVEGHSNFGLTLTKKKQKKKNHVIGLFSVKHKKLWKNYYQ